jgi:nicotinamidase-related amidase
MNFSRPRCSPRANHAQSLCNSARVASRDCDLHGAAPDKCEFALLLIDVINDLEFPGSRRLLRRALPAAKRIAALKKRARKRGVPVVYVNDNFGKWRSDFRRQVQHCLEDDVLGRPITALLEPEDDDYFVLKPKHSGFFSTQLDILLDHLGAQTLILTGFAGNLCVLYTANDAYMRDFRLMVPRDCVASETPAADRTALKHMRRWLKADTRVSTKIRFPRAPARSS